MSKLKVIDILEEDQDCHIAVIEQRYGGGYIAALFYGTDVEALDYTLTGGDYYNEIGTILLEQLNIPHAHGDDPVSAVSNLMALDTNLRAGEFSEMYRGFHKAITGEKDGAELRALVDSGEYADSVKAAYQAILLN